jgi:hypothetical protein
MIEKPSELFMAALPRKQASTPTLSQSESILQKKIQDISQMEDSERKFNNLLEIYHLLENEKEIE